jgi:hypothetical protein
MREALNTYIEQRRRQIAIFEGLSAEQWARRGVHPQAGEHTVLEHAVNIAQHDVNHIEQIVRALGLENALF